MAGTLGGVVQGAATNAVGPGAMNAFGSGNIASGIGQMLGNAKPGGGTANMQPLNAVAPVPLPITQPAGASPTRSKAILQQFLNQMQ